MTPQVANRNPARFGTVYGRSARVRHRLSQKVTCVKGSRKSCRRTGAVVKR